MAQKDYHGLSVCLIYDEFSNRFVVGAEIDGGYVPFGQVSYAKFEKWYGNTATPPDAPVPAEASPAGDQPAQ